MTNDGGGKLGSWRGKIENVQNERWFKKLTRRQRSVDQYLSESEDGQILECVGVKVYRCRGVEI